MEEMIPLIFHGCKLARELETNLPNLGNQPNILLQSCDEIIRIFSSTRDRINSQFLIMEDTGEAMQQEQWLRYTTPTDLMLHGQVLEQQQEGGLLESSVAVPMELWRSGGGDEVLQPQADVADAGRGSTSSQLRSTRRRKDDGENRTIRVGAPRMGNTEIPPDDGFTWRKYGQKEILGSRFPRGYFRCTHQKMYNCPAKKQVQRLDNDPYTFQVKYRGHHACTMSSTAPSISIPPPPPRASSQQPPQSGPGPLGHWLSMDIRPPTGESGGTSTNITTTFADIQMYKNFSVSGSSSDMVGDGGAGPSTIPYGRDPDESYQPVAKFADVMFNPRTSTNSDFHLIFSSPNDDHHSY